MQSPKIVVFGIDINNAVRYTVITIKSALGTAPLTAQQPAKGKVLKAERWVNTNYKGLIGRRHFVRKCLLWLL